MSLPFFAFVFFLIVVIFVIGKEFLIAVVKNIYRYFTFYILLVIAIAGGVSVLGSSETSDLEECFFSQNATVSCSLDNYSPTSDFFLPNRVSSANVFRVQVTSKRNNYSSRVYLELFKSSKLANFCARNNSKNQSLFNHTLFAKSICRLSSLGKLMSNYL